MALEITIEIDTMDPAMADAIYSGVTHVVNRETRRDDELHEVTTRMIFNPNK